MTPQLKSTLKTPLIGKIYELDDYLESVSTLPPKRMQRLIVEPMMHQVGILHQQAMRELRGLDYFKRAKDTLFEVQAAQIVMDERLSRLNLHRNKRKTYIQPVRHGVLWCGHFIYADRMYTSNRTIHNCERRVMAALVNPTLRKARRLQQTINSYFGMMRHSQEYKTQKRIACSIEVSECSKWLMFEEYESHIVCRMRKEYRPAALSAVELLELENYYKHKEYDSNTN